jgi:polar amino acid transport system substrate-binding protein
MRLPSILGAVAVLSASVGAVALDLPEVKTRGVLRVIAAADEAPETFSFGGGENPGLDRELAEGFARLQGVRLEPVKAKSYADRIPALIRGEGDVIVAMFDTEDRRKLVDFTVEIMPTHNVAVTLAPRPAVASVADLASLKVGAVKGARPAEEVVEAGVPATSVQLFGNLDDRTQALQKGLIDAMVLPVSELAVVSRHTKGLVAGTTVGPKGKIAWAVRKGDTSLRAALDDYLTNVRRSPSWSRLIVKYFGDQALQVLGRAK